MVHTLLEHASTIFALNYERIVAFECDFQLHEKLFPRSNISETRTDWAETPILWTQFDERVGCLSKYDTLICTYVQFCMSIALCGYVAPLDHL